MNIQEQDQPNGNIIEILRHGRSLSVFAANIGNSGRMNDLFSVIDPIFEEISPFLQDKRHVLLIRDNKDESIDGIYPVGHCYSRNEVQIAVPQWPADDAQLKDAGAHELHHMARRQTVGYGKTLGEVITTEGLAVLYGVEKSGWIPPWATVSVPDDMYKKALNEWENASYSHKDWFFQGAYGRWIGYSIGFRLAQLFFREGFDLKKSLYCTADDLRKSATIPL